MRVAIASFSAMPAEFTDDARIAEALAERGASADIVPWDAEAEWDSFDAVVIRSTWDYAQRRDEFLRWCDSVGDRLHNSPEVVRWNSDKRYLTDLAAQEIPVVATDFLAPGEEARLDGEVVVKPSVSAGGRHSGRFGPAAHDAARRLIAEIHASGRTAMVQPFQPTLDLEGET